MNKLIITRGAPASGKTTFAKKEIFDGRADVRYNRDDIRRSHHPTDKWPGYKFSKTNEKAVTSVQTGLIQAALGIGQIVICDDTNLNEKTLNRLKKIAEDAGAEVEVKDFFDVPLHKLIERNLRREHSVGEDVIHRMFRKQLEIQNRVITPTEGLPECVIVDVDGTIADMRKGQAGGRKPYDWHLVKYDLPKENVLDIVRYYIHNSSQVIFLTGRDGVAFQDTRDWIVKNTFGSNLFVPMLYSRAVGDERPDCVIKEEILRAEVLPFYNVKFCVDDRNQMVDHWRALGLECWQVAAGRF